MMSDTEILELLFRDEARVQTSVEYEKPFVELIEPRADDSSVKIRGVPWDAFIIEADRFPSPDSVFAGNKGECKRADFILISELKKHILYIELKRTKKGNNHIVQQLAGAKCFIEYCKAIAKWFWKTPSFLEGYEERYVCFRYTGDRAKKEATRVDKNPELHDAPDKHQAIDSVPAKGVLYNKLVGKFG